MSLHRHFTALQPLHVDFPTIFTEMSFLNPCFLILFLLGKQGDERVVSPISNQRRRTFARRYPLISVSLTENLTEKSMEVLKLIYENPNMTSVEMAEKLKVTRSAIAQRIRFLKQKGILTRIGSDKGGFWKINQS